jgi:hypothetical protein
MPTSDAGNDLVWIGVGEGNGVWAKSTKEGVGKER